MSHTPAIGKIRSNSRPTLALASRDILVLDGNPGRCTIPIKFEWYADAPFIVVMAISVPDSRKEVVWEVSRDLLHLAFAERGREFGLGDLTVAVVEGSLLISILNYRNKSWRTFDLPPLLLSELLAEMQRIVPLDLKYLPNPKPYTPVDRRP